MSATGDDSRPLLRVVHGGVPTDEEIVALVAAVATTGSGADERPVTPSRWASRAAGLRLPLHPGPGAWKASGLPG